MCLCKAEVVVRGLGEDEIPRLVPHTRDVAAQEGGGLDGVGLLRRGASGLAAGRPIELLCRSP
eukprot:4100863-Pyramimonas_sp.AAC.1